MKPRLPAWALTLACGASALAAPAVHASPDPTAVALADLGLALLRGSAGPNAVASPVAVAAALGLVHAGTQGAAEREIEALFGPPPPGPANGPQAFKRRLPALLQQLGSGPAPASPAAAAAPPFVLASHAWVGQDVARSLPGAYTQRIAQRYAAGATRVNFQASEAARQQINGWTAHHTAGRVAELLPPGSVSATTQLTLSTALHFRSPWQQPFDSARTEPRPFQRADGSSTPVPTLNDERAVLQAELPGARLLALPFAGEAYTLLLAQPAEGRSLADWLQGLNGAALAGWPAALQPQRCALALPKLALAPQSAGLRTLLESLGAKTLFTSAADLRPMLGRQARGAQLGEIFHAAGLQLDEAGGEAMAAAAATVQSKSLALPAPACAVDRPFFFVVLHRASGTPLFMGRVGDPAAGG